MTARGRAGQVTARGRAGQVTARGRAGQVTARGRAGQVTARGRAGQVTARGRAGQVTARGRAARGGIFMKIFISYRRSDTRHLAGRLSDILREAKNVDTVFIDVESIAPGAEFEEEMLRELREADICLALMGEAWSAGERIHDERDPVRLEIRAALTEAEASSLNLAPIMVDGAQMPPPEALPPDLRGLSGRNARPLSHATFRTDLEALAEQLGIDLAPEHTVKDAVIRSTVGAAIALGAFFMFSLIHKGALNRSLETTLGSRAALVAVFLAVIIAGAALPNVLSWARQRR